MSTVRLTGTTSGYVELTAPAVAGDNTVTLPSSNGAANQLLKNGATAGSLEFASNVVIDSSGRLLVGTSSSLSIGRLEVLSNAALSTYTNDGFANALVFVKNRNTSVGSHTVVVDGDELGSILFRGSDGSALVNAASITARVDGTPGTNDMPGRLSFSTTADGAASPTERMRITNQGNVGINRTPAADARLDVNGLTRLNATATSFTSALGAIVQTGSGTSGGPVAIESTAVSTVTRHHISFSNPNGVIGSISTNGSATAYNTSSDYRLKENVTLLDGAIDRLKQLPVHRFNFIADPDTVVDGFIAHEAAEVVPEAVTGTKDAVDDDGTPVYQGIDQSKIVPLLTAALQEAIGKIDALESRLAALEANP